jgi:hypothetical protein
VRGPKARRVGIASSCVRYRPALLDLLADPTGAALPPRARAHLDGCAACHLEFTDTVLMGMAVRRSLAPAREALPPGDAWPRLRNRLSRQRRTQTPGRAASPLLGVALATGLAIATLVPLGLRLASPHVLHEAGVDPAAIRAADHRDAADEARLMRASAIRGRETYATEAGSPAPPGLVNLQAGVAAAVRSASQSPLIAAPR